MKLAMKMANRLYNRRPGVTVSTMQLHEANPPLWLSMQPVLCRDSRWRVPMFRTLTTAITDMVQPIVAVRATLHLAAAAWEDVWLLKQEKLNGR